MTEERALAIRPSLTREAWGLIQAVAPTMYVSQFFGVRSPEQAAAIMVKGYELGLGIGASFEFIHVIQGKPGLSPRGALALIQQHPDFKSMQIEDITNDNGEPAACRVTMTRKNGFEYAAEFSMDDARRAELMAPKSGWEKYPANMLRWRAVGFAADVVFPDVLGGMRRTDELGADLSATGDTIEADYSVITTHKQKTTPQAKAAPLALQSKTRPQGNSPLDTAMLCEKIRERGGWAREGDRFVRFTGEGAEPVSRESRQKVQAVLGMALAFDGASDNEIAQNAHAVLRWLFNVERSAMLTEREAQAILYAWMDGEKTLNEYAGREARACLEAALGREEKTE